MISLGTPVAKAAHWVFSDAEVRKLGERTGLDTPVVLAVNDEHWVEETSTVISAVAKVSSAPPGEYGRKAETQRN